MKKTKLALQLFLDYLLIGAVSFGGGLGMIALVEKVFVQKRKQITEEELLNIVSIAESTPGPIAVNTATYIGYKVLGFFGAILATFGAILPVFSIMLVVAIFYDKLMDITLIKYMVNGIMIAFCYLIISSSIKLFKSAKKDALSYIFMTLSFIALMLINIFSLNISTIYIFLIGGIISAIIFIIKELSKRKEKNKENTNNEEANE